MSVKQKERGVRTCCQAYLVNLLREVSHASMGICVLTSPARPCVLTKHQWPLAIAGVALVGGEGVGWG